MARPSRRLAAVSAIPARDRVNLEWLIRLRWAQIAGQASTVALVALLVDVELPLLALALVVGVGLVSNVAVAAYFRDRPVHEGHVAAVMALDVALLTSLLYFTGGPLNPFGFLYLVQIALATVLLHAALAWTLVGLSFLCFGLLLIGSQPLPISDHTRMIGMWVALGVASAFIVHFLLRVLAALAARERELTVARNLASRQERLASLATMAAGAAHELATPLGTVALVAKELERSLTRTGDTQAVDDARLIREQVGRCRMILDQMAGSTAAAGEGIEARTVDELLDETLTTVRAAPPIERRVPPEVGRLPVKLPPRAVCQALRSLVTNAQDASPADGKVVVSAARDAGGLRLDVLDLGDGMPAEILARIGEPFFTTKEPGRGMGLGLYLARAVVESVGGSLAIDSRLGEGTRVSVVIPTEVIVDKTGAPDVVSKGT
ncbi:MAG: HAMP domain-containing histidine kinase [Kofleriaceae bacterium]|nr:HAMP domain-containing histidine kinase [Myxococcales bacterium]MCB9562372.1 HAMP domain-containing histidine kinase [Kofleriaceae bacterium]